MTNFPERYKELSLWMDKLGVAIPQTMKGFSELHQSSIAPGVLDCKTKELLALGIAIVVRCEGCITFHVHDALHAGASKDEIAETVSVAILMGGGPAVVYGIEALQAVSQYQALGL
ncbi:MAG: carboxymuconolactone decarboxylase family protein [Shewanella sp.]|uniref:carboxymuconolactone decarboxylase family protein n=1 Tax=Shewanella sp. TaxID=50422 RepID=UPI003C754A1B